MGENDACFFCDGPTKCNPGQFDGTGITCERCGTYEVSRSLLREWEASPSFPRLRRYLACHVRQRPEESGCERFQTYDWEGIAKRHEDTSPMRKADIALAYVVRHSKSKEDEQILVSLDEGLYFDAVTTGQVEQVLKHLASEGLITFLGNGMEGFLSSGKAFAKPTLKGAQHYWAGGDPVKSTTCFVAMSFDDELARAFDEAIKPAAKACGYDAERVDLREFNGEITDEIMAGIRRSRFLIADFTGHKGGVYFEAGFALGLGREVIFTCRKDNLQDCHFDTKHYKHIDWVDMVDLRKRLVSRIMGTIGPPVRD